jgi:hypothetical protein
MSDTCPSCSVPWSEHSGIAVTCRKLREAEAALSAIRFRCLICGLKTDCKHVGRCVVCGKNQWEALL